MANPHFQCARGLRGTLVVDSTGHVDWKLQLTARAVTRITASPANVGQDIVDGGSYSRGCEYEPLTKTIKERQLTHTVELRDQERIACPICDTVIVGAEGPREQPSCGHVTFIYLGPTGDFEYVRPDLEAVLDEADEETDEDPEIDALQLATGSLGACDQLIHSCTSNVLACDDLWIGIKGQDRTTT